MRPIALLVFLSLLSLPVSAQKKVIVPPEFAPAAGAPAPPFSPGILINGTLYVAGQIGQDLKTKQIPSGFRG